MILENIIDRTKKIFTINKFHRRLSLYSFVLLFIIIILCSTVSYYVCKSIIVNEVKKINEGTTSGVIVRMNMILEEMVSLLNTASNDDRIDITSTSTIIPSEKNENPTPNQSIPSTYTTAPKDNPEDLNVHNNIKKQNIESSLSRYIEDYSMIEAIVHISQNDVYAGFNSLFYLSDVSYKNPYSYSQLADIYQDLKSKGMDYKDIYFTRLTFNKASRFVMFKPIESYGVVKSFYLISFKDNLLENSQFSWTQVYLMKDNYKVSICPETTKEAVPKALEEFNPSGSLLWGSHLMYKKRVSTDGWNMLFIISIQDILDDIAQLMYFFLFFAAIYISVIMLIAARYTRNITTGMQSLQKSISSILNSNFEVYESYYTSHNSKGHLFGNSSLRTRILIFFILIIIIPVLFITSLTYYKSISIVKHKVGTDIKNSITRVSDQVNFILENYMKTCNYIAAKPDIHIFLSDSQLQHDENKRSKISNLVINRLSSYRDIFNVSIYDNDGKKVFTLIDNQNENYLQEIKKDMKYLKINSTAKLWKKLYLNYSDSEFFHIAMRLRDLQSTPLGYLMLDLSTAPIDHIFRQTTLNTNLSIYLLDTDGNYITSVSQNDLVISQTNLFKMQKKRSGQLSQEDNNKQYYIIYNTLPINGWKLVTTIPTSDYLKNTNKIFTYNAIMLIVYIMIVIALSYRLSWSVSRNLNHFKLGAERLKYGELSTVDVEKSGDEIEELGHMFNMMVENIRKLINEVYITEIKFKEAQFNALQAQINPHFLYNTLETIHFMIVIGDNKAVRMVQLLGDLFRVGIGKGERFITVEQEVNHVRLYLEIQQIRYSNKFKAVIDMNDDVNQLYLIKFVLQPIVENSIYHGIELMEEDGLISITGRIEDNKLMICVTDNGIGMDENALSNLQDKLEGKIKAKGIGFTNVNERIRLNFGNEYGVYVESQENQGTKVTIWLPIIRENPDTSEKGSVNH